MGPEENDVNHIQEKVSGNEARAGTPPAIRFEDLSQGENEVVIQYHDQHYRLRVTRNGKLILNK